jgi:hypothetical protein
METNMSDIKIARLSTGEELLATVKETTTGYNFSDVAILIPTQQNSLGLAPFMAYSEAAKGMDIDKSFVMFMVDPVNDLKNQYQSMFNKVVTPDKKIII